jgi:hypothetical protein
MAEASFIWRAVAGLKPDVAACREDPKASAWCSQLDVMKVGDEERH